MIPKIVEEKATKSVTRLSSLSDRDEFEEKIDGEDVNIAKQQPKKSLSLPPKATKKFLPTSSKAIDSSKQQPPKVAMAKKNTKRKSSDDEMMSEPSSSTNRTTRSKKKEKLRQAQLKRNIEASKNPIVIDDDSETEVEEGSPMKKKRLTYKPPPVRILMSRLTYSLLVQSNISF